MRNGVFLDTSYLITLADPARDRHAVAKRYYQEFCNHPNYIFLPALIYSFSIDLQTDYF